jgi:creatinine amidohydrolase
MHPTVLELERRLFALPEVLARVARATLPEYGALGAGRLVLTGVGMSECVARFVEAVLRYEVRCDVTALPLSAFVSEDVKAQGEVLVVLSQGLSPNARLALSRAREFSGALLVTSRPASDQRLRDFVTGGGVVWTLPLEEETGFLTRVQGPLATGLAMLRLGFRGAEPPVAAELPAKVRAALTTGLALAQDWPLDVRRAPLLSTGWYSRCLDLLAWTWMETWWVEPPPVWDVLQTAHGPWQQLSLREETLLALTRPDDVPDLWPRLRKMLGAQRLVPLPATLRAPWAWFEHAAMVLGLLVGVLKRAPVDLSAWPGRDGDGPLYELGALTAPAARPKP